jgi:DNA-directed RNA polymerase specialized sigma24 family protein
MAEESIHRGTEQASLFPQTNWDILQRLGISGSAETDAILTTIYRGYWFPLYAYVRKAGLSIADAEDVTQSFFISLLSADTLLRADPAKGKLRAWLLACLKKHLANHIRHGLAAKRGGQIEHIPLHLCWAEERLEKEPSCEPALEPDNAYDRRWAQLMIDEVKGEIRSEFAARGRMVLFEAIHPLLASQPAGRGECTRVARQLGINEATVRVSLSRLRVRFTQGLRDKARALSKSSGDTSDELKLLAQALA